MFEVLETSLHGLSIIKNLRSEDQRGYFERIYCSESLCPGLLGESILQINRSFSKACGTLRGLHFQTYPVTEQKMVRCIRGRVYDVAVDVRRGSPTFLQWHAEVLEGSSPKSLLIGCGFAHGFQTLSDDCEMLYFHTKPHSPANEGGLNPRDPALGIPWPEPISEISIKDSGRKFLDGRYETLLP